MPFFSYRFWDHPLTIAIVSLLNDRFKRIKFLSSSPHQHTDVLANSASLRATISSSSNGPLGVGCLYKSLETASLVLKIARDIEPKLKCPENEIVSERINSFYLALDKLQEQVYNGYLMFNNKHVIAIEGLPSAGI